MFLTPKPNTFTVSHTVRTFSALKLADLYAQRIYLNEKTALLITLLAQLAYQAA
jgi:hypothetical protein